MKIAYLTGEYPRATDTFIQREVAALRNLGLDVSTCSIRRTGREHLVGPEQVSEAARTFYILAAMGPIRVLLDHFGWIMRNPVSYFRGLALAFRTAPKGFRGLLYQLIYFVEAGFLAAHMKRNGITHLHNHIAKASCTVAMLASAISDIPFSFTLHGPDIFFEPKHWRLDEKIARAKFVACISNFCRSQAMVFSGAKDTEKLKIVHCGIDPRRYEETVNTDGHQLLFVGRMAQVKGVPLLLNAVASLSKSHPKTHLTLIGDGPDRAALEKQAETLGIIDHVSFEGYQSQAAVSEALSASDLFVLPSFAEGVPVVLMEAMAAKRAVLTTRIAGIPELIEDGQSGVLVTPGDQNALTQSLATLLDDPALRDRLGAKARTKVQAEFNITTEAAKLAMFFKGTSS